MRGQRSETHQLFPSGDWEGFFTYSFGPGVERHPMHCRLNFKLGKVHGTGSDDIGPFSWKGTYNKRMLECQLIKTYRNQSKVGYQGHVDENGIWGSWTIGKGDRGGFHLWPKDTGQQGQEASSASKKKVRSAS